MLDIKSHPGNSNWIKAENVCNYKQDDLNSCNRVPHMSMLKKMFAHNNAKRGLE